jgi:hypothetical protein
MLLDAPRPVTRVTAADIVELQTALAAGPPVEERSNPAERAYDIVSLPDFGTRERLVRAGIPDMDEIMITAPGYYPPGGGVGWHTDGFNPGWNIYAVRASGHSRFLTADAAYEDEDGIANIFRVCKGAWHAAFAEDERWVLGVRVSDRLAEEILAAAKC